MYCRTTTASTVADSWRHAMPEPERLSDYAAMNAIARTLMEDENWSMDTVDEIAQIVLQTGRDWED